MGSDGIARLLMVTAAAAVTSASITICNTMAGNQPGAIGPPAPHANPFREPP